MPRKGYEFSQRTRNEAIRRWHRDNPGREDEELEVHHRVPVYYARKHGIHPDVVRSQDNAQAMPKSEHRGVDHYDEEQINAHLSSLANFLGRLFE